MALRAEREEEPIYVADSAIYSEATMTELDRKRVWWVGRVPETSTRAKALVAEEPATWQGTEVLRWYEQEVRIGERSRSASSGRSDCAPSISAPLPVRRTHR